MISDLKTNIKLLLTLPYGKSGKAVIYKIAKNITLKLKPKITRSKIWEIKAHNQENNETIIFGMDIYYYQRKR